MSIEELKKIKSVLERHSPIKVDRINRPTEFLGFIEPECVEAITKLNAIIEQMEKAEPVAWRDPSNKIPGQGCTYEKTVHEKWPHIYHQPLHTSPAPTPDDRMDAELGRALRPNYEAAKKHGVDHISWRVSEIDAAMKGEK